MWRTFRYRVYPNRAQAQLLHSQVDEACRLYNAALEERRSAWRMNRIRLNYYHQANQLKTIRAAGHIGIPNFSVCQNVLRRVEKTFSSFFTHAKRGETPGYPRFRSHARYDSLTWPNWGHGCALRASGRLYLHGIGEVKVKWHRPLPIDACLKMVTVKRDAGRWYACFVLETPPAQPLPPCNLAIGVDLGLNSFAVTSDGMEIANPRYLRAAQRQLRMAQRKLARRRKRSHRRQKAREQVARLHCHVRNQRLDFHYKIARRLVQGYGLVAVEDLKVKGLASSMLAKSVLDAGWTQFLRILAVKAEEAGRLLIAVNPAGTTQRCSACSSHVPKKLSERWHKCAACGLTIGRDENAARNILRLAQRPGWGLQAQTVGLAAPLPEKPPASLAESSQNTRSNCSASARSAPATTDAGTVPSSYESRRWAAVLNQIPTCGGGPTTRTLTLAAPDS